MEAAHDWVSFRPFQKQFIETALAKAQAGKKTVIANVHPGSGKTLACLAAADLLFQQGYINRVVVLVPRINLAEQFETDWAEFRNRLPWKPTMRELRHMPNTTHLIHDGADGYITTYDSLVSEPDIHYRSIRHGKTLLICDEMQQLGVDYDSTVTMSAAAVERAIEFSVMYFGLSGTPYRADGSRLLGATYSEPDGDGICKLQADVEATYRQGVAGGYLRELESVLHDGRSVMQKFGFDPEERDLSGMERNFYPILEYPGYWQPFIDHFIQQVSEDKEFVDRRLCGLVATYRMKHAREIKAYIEQKYPHLRTVLAVSEDGTKAHQSLKAFREGNYDVLVTVNMAYVGYDHKPICNIALLTAYRTEGYLRQLFARGLRVWDAIPSEKWQQICRVFVPDDVRMVDFVNKMRNESEIGVHDKQQPKERETSANGERLEQQELEVVLDAFLTDIYAMGATPNGDLNPQQYQIIEYARRQLKIPVASSTLMELVKMLPASFIGVQVAEEEPYRLYKDRMVDVRRELSDRARQLDKMRDQPFGTTYGALFARFGKGVEDCQSIQEIEERIQAVLEWMRKGTDDN